MPATPAAAATAPQEDPSMVQDPAPTAAEDTLPKGVSFAERGVEVPVVPLAASDEIVSVPVAFPDPRRGGAALVEVIAFDFPSGLAPCDELCMAPFLGNGYDLAPQGLELRDKTFRTAEGAFQALKFWDQADDFASLSGSEAAALGSKLSAMRGDDGAYADFGGPWGAMLSVLAAKFRPGSACHQALLQTGDAYLLKHDAAGTDSLWTNAGASGRGRNWLGLLLMLLRDHLSDPSEMTWSPYLESECAIDNMSGEHESEAGRVAWQRSVENATAAVMAKLG